MANKISRLKNTFLCLSASAVALTSPAIAYAIPARPSYAPDPDIPSPTNTQESVKIIVELIGSLLNIFLAAGIVLLAYSTFSLVLAVKDENIESKVQATSQLAVSLVLITFSSLLKGLASVVNVYL